MTTLNQNILTLLENRDEKAIENMNNQEKIDLLRNELANLLLIVLRGGPLLQETIDHIDEVMEKTS